MTIQDELTLFGLNPNEQEVYLLLLKLNWVTALQISRHTSIKRPTLYRILDRLAGMGLVETQIDDKTTNYNAADPRQFESLILEEESKSQRMREAYGDVIRRLSILSKVKNKETIVKFYRGKKALQYMEYKRTEIKNTEICILGSNNWYKVHGEAFAEDIRQKTLDAGITIRELQNPHSMQSIGPDGKTTWTQKIDYVKHCYRHRWVPKKLLEITNDIYIFDDHIHLNGYKNDDLVGIEIINHEYAHMFRQIFEVLWGQSKVIDSFGNQIT